MQGSLRSQQHSLIRQLADSIESVWREYLDLSPYSVPHDLGYIQGHLEGERLVIENHCYQSTHFRKLHLELAHIGNGMDILHCVMFPNPDYALPIFGTDLVGKRGGAVSAAIVDLSPVSADLSLPRSYQDALSVLPDPQFAHPRVLPDWADIFSEHCLFVRPVGDQEEEQYLQRVKSFLEIHCKLATTELPLESQMDILHVLEGQQNYCTKQQQNDKTRRILEKSFGSEWTDRYMNTMLFDYVTV